MLTGVYMLKSTKSRFNQYEVEHICPLCRLAAENLQHMLLRGPVLSDVSLHQIAADSTFWVVALMHRLSPYV